MSGKHLTWMAIALAVVVGAVALLVPGDINRDKAAGTGTFLPDLAARVNDAVALEVIAAGDETVARLGRRDDQWVIDQLAGYPADWDKVRAVLAGLAEATVIEPKTANPDYYPRLGVEDVDSASAAGVLLTVGFAEGEPLGVILGQAASGREGRYLRVLGETASVLADFDADVPRDAAGWADTTVVDLAADNVAEVRITQPGGAPLRVWKRSADDTDFVLDGGLPEGRELKSIWAMNSLGGALAGVRFEDVRPADELDWADATNVQVLTFTGVQVTAELAGDEDGRWLRLSAEAPFEKDLEDAEEVDAAADDDEADIPAAESAADRAGRINDRTAGWAYRIPDRKAEAMDKGLEDLMKPLEDPAADEDA